MRNSARQALEERILEDLEPIGYRGTAGSGNKLNDGDVKARYIDSELLQFGFECKDRSTQAHHGVPAADWKKAKLQIRSAGFDPIFVTRNSKGEILAHLLWDDFIALLELVTKKDRAGQ